MRRFGARTWAIPVALGLGLGARALIVASRRGTADPSSPTLSLLPPAPSQSVAGEEGQSSRGVWSAEEGTEPARVQSRAPRYRVGHPYGSAWRFPGDGVEYRYRDGHELRVTLRNLTKREIAMIGGEAEVQLALVLEEQVFTLAAGFEGVISWSGAPYCWHRLRDAERTLPAPLADGEAARLTIVLVEGCSGIVRAVRRVTLPAEFAHALHTAIRDQAERSFDEAEYQRQADRLQQLWRSGELVVDQAACA